MGSYRNLFCGESVLNQPGLVPGTTFRRRFFAPEFTFFCVLLQIVRNQIVIFVDGIQNPLEFDGSPHPPGEALGTQ